VLEKIASGSWIARDRVVAYTALLLVGYVGGIVWMLATSAGLADAWGRPLGTDFSNVWSAGQLALTGLPEAVYDWPRHHAEQKLIFGDPAVPFFGWHYPPFFLLVAAGLATLPYLSALALWQGATLSAYLLAIHRIVPGRAIVLPALAFPAVLVNLLHGQNGFLTAALLGGGLCLLPGRAVAAGMLLGLLAYKPHLGLMVPLALAAGGYWRAFIAAAVTVVTVAMLSLAVFGETSWLAFLDSLTLTRTQVLEAGSTGWQKIQSVFSQARMLGAPIALAYAVQGAVALVCAGAVVWLWRSRAFYPLKAAGLIAASLLATPYQLDYDLMVLGPAIAFMAAHGTAAGFARYGKSLLAAVWFTPLVTRGVAELIPLSLGVVATGALLAMILARAGTGAPPHEAPTS